MIIKILLLILTIGLFFVIKNRWKIFRKRYIYKKIAIIVKRDYMKNGYLEFSNGRNFTLKLPEVEKFEENPLFIAPYFTDFVFPFLDSYGFTSTELKKYCKAVKNSEGPYIKGKVTIESGDVVIDAGANIGFFSALSSALGGIVYAFEPVGETREKYLSKVAKLNPNIYIFPFVLSNITGEAEIEIPVSEDLLELGSSSIVKKYKNCIKEKIKTITLDRWVEENNIKKIDFIKADIEGAERLMLEGAANVLKNFAPKLSICTYHLPDDKKVLTELILKSNPNYTIEYGKSKLYAYVK